VDANVRNILNMISDRGRPASWILTRFQPTVDVTFECLKDLLIDLISRGQKARIHTHLTPISISIFVSISISVCISVCTDMSRSPEEYLHRPTAYQTDLSSEAHNTGTHATVDVTVYGRSDLLIRAYGS